MTETQTQTQSEELRSMKKQIKILTIVLFGLSVLIFTSIIREFSGRSGSEPGWPDVSAGVLQAKRIVLMTNDGKPAGMLSTVDGSSGLALLDSKGEIRVFLSTKGNKGLISLSGEGQEQSTYLTNGALNIGDGKAGGISVEGPPSGLPLIRVFDNSGYSAQIGRSSFLTPGDGTVSTTSAASLMGSSKEKALTWSLLSQPAFTSASTPPQSNSSKGVSSQTQGGAR